MSWFTCRGHVGTMHNTHLISARRSSKLPAVGDLGGGGGDRRYFYRSQTDLGRVENSEEAGLHDEPVLHAELDVEALARDA